MKIKIIITTLLLPLITGINLKAQTLDASFGLGGRVRTITAGRINAVARQNDGKIVVGGSGYLDFNDQFQLIRFNANGNIDSSFGINGIVQTAINFMSSANAIVMQPDGKIIVGGTYYTGDFANIYHLVVARYNADGSLDNTFGTNGLAMPEPGFTDELADMVLQPDGKIIIGGAISDDANIGIPSFLLGRLNSDGTIDAAFGTNGFATTAINATSQIKDIALLADGSIIAAGQAGLYDSPNPDYRDFAIAKYNPQGNLDVTFGTNGFTETDVVTGAADFLHSMVVQPDGRILTAGTSGNNHYLVRYYNNGSIDNSFGTNGKSIRTGSPGTLQVALRNDGKILTTCAMDPITMSTDFMMNGYLANGSVDAAFGNNGTLLTDFPSAIPEGSNDVSTCMFIAPDGKIVAAGSAEGNVALARYNGTGPSAIKNTSFNNLDLSVYPNPCSDVLNLRLNGLSGSMPATIVLNNVLGQQVFSTSITLKATNTTVALPNLIAGNYILSVTTGGGDRLTRKITKE